MVAAIDQLRRRPARGKPLRSRLRELNSQRVGAYRILYLRAPKLKTGFIVSVRHRSEGYRHAR